MNKHIRRINADRKILNEYKYLRDFFDNIPDVIYFKDKKGRLILVNKAHAKGLGLNPEQVVGKTDSDIFGRKRAALMQRDDKFVISTGKPIIDKIERATRADGVDNYVSTTKIPRYDDKGRIIGLVGITRDITHRAQIERLREERDRIKKKLNSLEELDKLKSDFISVVSHELRTPLTIVKEGISLIIDGVKGPIEEGQKEVLQGTRNNVERLRKIIEELLDISRIEKGKLRLRYSLSNLKDLIKDSADYYKRLALEKGITLEYKLPKEELNIFIDPGKVSQVISNLIDNALKFTEQGGRVDIEVRLFDDKVRVGIIDTGVGIAKNDLKNIFEKFAQAPNTMAAKNKGIGLGLAIVRELVEKHGGEIWVESMPGVGSKFYFTLPRFYTMNLLHKEVRDKINDMLDKGISLYLINLAIINYQEFEKIILFKKKGLITEIEQIINSTIKEFSGLSGSRMKISSTGFHMGECSIILSEANERGLNNLSELLKDKINQYFSENRIDNVFINVGVLGFTYKKESSGGMDIPIYVKKIHIGAEKRRLKRYACQLPVVLFLAKNRKEETTALDISLGGICFIISKRPKTDENIYFKLSLPKHHEPLYLCARVAWIKELETQSQKEAFRYKTGVEFVRLKRGEKEAISLYIKSLSKKLSSKH